MRAKGGNPERFGALQNERDARHGELQTLGIEMRPLEDDLAGVQREVAKHMRAIAALQEDKQAANTQLQRAEQAHRVSFGTAKGVRLQALLSLANAASRSGSASSCPTARRQRTTPPSRPKRSARRKRSTAPRSTRTTTRRSRKA